MPQNEAAASNQEQYDKFAKDCYDAIVQEYEFFKQNSSPIKLESKVASEFRNLNLEKWKEIESEFVKKNNVNPKYLEELRWSFISTQDRYQESGKVDGFIKYDIPNAQNWNTTNVIIDSDTLIKFIITNLTWYDFRHHLTFGEAVIQTEANQPNSKSDKLEAVIQTEANQPNSKSDKLEISLPKTPTRQANDGYTALTSKQTLLLFVKLQEQRVLTDESYQNDKSLAMAISAVTGYHHEILRQALSTLRNQDNSIDRKDYERVIQTLRAITAKLETEMENFF